MQLTDTEIYKVMKGLDYPSSGCWEWKNCKNSTGYGQMTLLRVSKNPLYTHRLMWELYNGPIPKGLCVCHKCDNPPCCNPDHLFLGTMSDNMKDKVKKGRAKGGPRIYEPGTLCSVERCDNLQACRGWCKMHYTRWLRNGTLETLEIIPQSMFECCVEGCSLKADTKQMCRKHYIRFYRHGDPSVTIKKGPKGPWKNVG